jgi:hypothetical protein
MEELKKQLAIEGFFVIKNVLTLDECNKLLEISKNRAYRPVFKTIVPYVLDEKRLQAPISGNYSFKKKLEKIFSAIDLNWRSNRWVFLKSLPGGELQQPHRDFMNLEILQGFHQTKSFVCGMVLSLMENTRIRYYKEAFGAIKKEDEEFLDLDAGSIVIFRGDFAHSGVGFQNENVRIHCFLNVHGIPEFKDVTVPVLFQHYYCENVGCQDIYDLKKDLKRHRASCKFNPNYQINLEKIRAKKKARVKCGICGNDYARNSLSNHVKTMHPREEKCRARTSSSLRALLDCFSSDDDDAVNVDAGTDADADAGTDADGGGCNEDHSIVEYCASNCQKKKRLQRRQFSTISAHSAVLRVFQSVKKSDVRQPRGNTGKNAGELTPQATSELIKAYKITNMDIFADIGSGIGNVVAQFALETPVKAAIGIEIRYDLAMLGAKLIQEYSKEFQPLEKVKIYPRDVCSIDIKDDLMFSNVSLLFCHNTLFNSEVNFYVENLCCRLQSLRTIVLQTPFCPRHRPRCSREFCNLFTRREDHLVLGVTFTSSQVKVEVYDRNG